MATVRKEITLEARADEVWAAFVDIGAIHERLARGFVTDTKLESPGIRIVTFANGIVAREVIVTIDPEARRLAYSAAGARLSHHNASFQLFPEGERRTRVVWLADLLPNEMAPAISGMMDEGCAAMKRTLEPAVR